ncbi:MAG TPA: acyltransferase, partial [Patescibacteria group bacterium]
MIIKKLKKKNNKAELQNTRKLYIDNIRWGIIILVVIFHVVDIFNSTGAILHFNSPGIAAFDSFAYFVYPWFMGCLFVVAGISARYSLNKRNAKEFAKGRVLKLLIPFLAGMLLLAPLTTILSFTATNSWYQFAAVPPVVLYFVLIAIGMGHLWFILELFVVSMIFLLIRHFDKKDKIWNLGGKTSMGILLLTYIPLLGAAQVLNFLAVFRNVLFLCLFLLGYFVFSHDNIQEMLKKYHAPLLITAIILFIIQIPVYWGQNFTGIVNQPLVMLYNWIMIL